MTGETTANGVPLVDSPYFFLSYAHSVPQEGFPEANPDELVSEFYGHLVRAVTRHASQRPGIVPGFYDREIPVGSDWKESLSQALGRAQVFVSLLSAGYVTRSRPGRELACYRQRVEKAGLDDPRQRLVPVLWSPLPETQNPPGLLEAKALTADVPAYIKQAYVENGLRALLMLKSYRTAYRAVVELLAKRITDIAETHPIGPSEVPDIDRTKSVYTPEPHRAVFAIEVAAPTIRTTVPGHESRGYGEESLQWRPFAEQELTLAEYAGQVAERLDFRAEISGIKTVSDPLARRPGIILIDPWFIADEEGQTMLGSAVAKLPRWVLPLVVLSKSEDPLTQALAKQVMDILGEAGAVQTDSSLRAARGVGSLDEFVLIVPALVVEAERRYLRYRRERVASPPSGKRPSLRRPVQPD